MLDSDPAPGWSRHCLGRDRLDQGGPHEPDQLAGARHDGHRGTLAVPHEVPVRPVEPLLGPPRLGADRRGLPLAAPGEGEAEPRRAAGMPARFDEDVHAWVLPTLVILPCCARSPEAASLGTRPK